MAERRGANHWSRFDMTGRVALVTGSSRGIGRAIALGLAECGANVGVHCLSRVTEANEVAKAIAATGTRAVAASANLSNPLQCRQLVRAVEADLGPIDILVLNASMEIRHDWTEVTDKEFDLQVTVDLKSSLKLLQATVPAMAERRWGRVVSIGSIQEAKPNPRLLIYAALKSAQTNLLLNLARQYAGSGVTFNNVAPGAIATDRNASVLSDTEYRTRVLSQIPAGRIGTPDDCVGACQLLCSEAGSYITGSTLFVDGGWHAA